MAGQILLFSPVRNRIGASFIWQTWVWSFAVLTNNVEINVSIEKCAHIIVSAKKSRQDGLQESS